MLESALSELCATRAIALPAGNPWQRGRLPIADAGQRLVMLELAFGNDARVTIDARELARRGPTYTIDTLTELDRERASDETLVWLIGSDAFARLESWHRWQALFDFATFAVVMREGDAALALSPALAACAKDRYVMLAARPPAVSSTVIRARLAAGESIRGLTPDPICDYIAQNKLYC